MHESTNSQSTAEHLLAKPQQKDDYRNNGVIELPTVMQNYTNSI